MATKKKTEQKLLKALRSEDVSVRITAARYRYATPQVLLAALEDKDKYVRCIASPQYHYKGKKKLKRACLQRSVAQHSVVGKRGTGFLQCVFCFTFVLFCLGR